MVEFDRVKHSFLTVNGQKISIYRKGQGVPLVFFHGFLGDHFTWHDLFDHSNLQSAYQLVSVELPGHGQSSGVNLNWTWNDFIDFTRDVLLNMNIVPSEAHFMGHSLGGYISLSLANRFGALSVGILNSNTWSDSDFRKKERRRAVRVFDLNHSLYVREAVTNLVSTNNLSRLEREVALLKNIALKTDVESAKHYLLLMTQRLDLTEWAQNTDVPIHIIAGDEDNICSFEKLKRISTDNSIQFHPIQNCGHMAFVEKPRQLNEIVKSIY